MSFDNAAELIAREIEAKTPVIGINNIYSAVKRKNNLRSVSAAIPLVNKDLKAIIDNVQKQVISEFGTSIIVPGTLKALKEIAYDEVRDLAWGEPINGMSNRLSPKQCSMIQTIHRENLAFLTLLKQNRGIEGLKEHVLNECTDAGVKLLEMGIYLKLPEIMEYSLKSAKEINELLEKPWKTNKERFENLTDAVVAIKASEIYKKTKRE